MLLASGEESSLLLFKKAASDFRVWLLFLAYGGCFGTELTMNNVLATYFFDYFGMNTTDAGTAASLFGLMNLFARPHGGVNPCFGGRFGTANAPNLGFRLDFRQVPRWHRIGPGRQTLGHARPALGLLLHAMPRGGDALLF